MEWGYKFDSFKKCLDLRIDREFRIRLHSHGCVTNERHTDESHVSNVDTDVSGGSWLVVDGGLVTKSKRVRAKKEGCHLGPPVPLAAVLHGVEMKIEEIPFHVGKKCVLLRLLTTENDKFFWIHFIFELRCRKIDGH